MNATKMISMVERKDIISAYERTMSMRAVSRELGLSRKTVISFIYSNKIVVYHDRQIVATHEKTPVNGWKLDLMHYRLRRVRICIM